MKPWWIAAGSLLLFSTLPAAPVTAQEEVITQDVCSDCHEDEATSFLGSPHGRAIKAWDPEVLERSCVGCHGPATEHVEDPSQENIRRQPGPEACQSCHQGSVGQLFVATPSHTRYQVSCLDCHASGHGDPETDSLLAAAPAQLCGDCHQTEARAFDRPFAHREGSEPFSCTQCHSAHGTTRTGRLLQRGSGGACLDCHTEKAGPFVFPHPARDVDGCVACHQPHGSTNPRLLTRSSVFNLCLECHSDVPVFHDLSQARFRTCQSCHVAVHGSNREPKLFDE